MGTHCWLERAGIALLASAAFAQTDPQVPSAPVQPPAQQAPASVAGRTPESVADAARSSREASESAPPAKVYRNKDVRDPVEQFTSNQPPAKTSDEGFMDQEHQSEAQGGAYKNEILAQEAKIVGIQNHIDELDSQFTEWTTWHTDISDVSLCWTDLGTTYYYKDYCNVGKGLRAQAQAAQQQLAQEKSRLAEMQEYIRRQGYGNAVYEPDE
jgi:hypothetical protein